MSDCSPNTVTAVVPLTISGLTSNIGLRAGTRIPVGMREVSKLSCRNVNTIRSRSIVRELPRLSVNDGFAFALAESHPDCILLSGDDALRSLAATHAIEVHGVLWVLDELHVNRLTPPAAILTVLHTFRDDATVRLPRRELTAYIKRYEHLK